MNVEILNLRINGDDRGSLIAIEQMNEIPFEIKRIYYIFDTKPTIRRGFHAHKDLQQVAVCVKGHCSILLDDGIEQKEVLLNRPNKGLLINNMIWREMYNFSPDCVLLVLASEYYNEKDYIRNYKEFKNYVSK